MSVATQRVGRGVRSGHASRSPRVGSLHNVPMARRRRVVSRPTLLALAVFLLPVVAYWLWPVVGQWYRSQEQLPTYTVTRTTLPIVVTERGNLESQQVTQVLCEVDDIPGDSINGTTIVWIIPNGSRVKKGDLLVELDSSGHRERLDLQILDTERARAAQVQAKVKYENQQTQNQTLKAEAELKVKLAELELEMFRDAENGTHQLEVEEIKRTIDDINNEILSAQANLELKKNDRLGIESLFKLGYAGKNEVDRARLEYLQAEAQYAAKVNRLKTQLATLAKKETYEHDMQLMQLEGKLQTARRNLEQVLRDNEASLAQAKAALDAANEALRKEEERLARYRECVEKCRIYAPADGMVAYATPEWRAEEIREGTAVRPRQLILTLPDLRHMQVKTAVHESVLDQITPGIKATIRVDALPDRVYSGTVKSVAVLPDQSNWLSADTKVYSTIVTIDEEVEQLKPGMTAVVELHVAELHDVLCVPVQALMQEKQKTWCYVESSRGIERRDVVVGRTNNKFVEIRQGLAEGDKVILTPLAVTAAPQAGEKSATAQPAG